jgi:hypothetical protein
MNRALPKSAPEQAPSRLPQDLPQSTVSEIASWLVGHTLDEVERELIHHTLENCGGDRVLAATVLGLSRPALRRKLTAYAVRGQALPEPAPAPEPEPAREPTLVPAAQESRAVAPVPQADNDRAPKPAAVVPRPEQAKRMDFRFLVGGALAAVLMLLIGVGLIGETKPGAGFTPPERARIELSVIERPQPFQHRITVPVWNGPQPLRAEPAIVDIAADKRIQPVAAPVREAVVPFASELDTRMELAAASDLDARMELAPADSELDARMELAAPDISRDTRMELATDSEQDTRMELDAVSESAAATAPETTGSIGTDATFVAPDDAPRPLARPATAAPAKAAPAAAKPAPRQAVRPRAAPAQAETPAQIAPPFFPFNIFAPRNGQRAAGGGASVPYDCCANN